MHVPASSTLQTAESIHVDCHRFNSHSRRIVSGIDTIERTTRKAGSHCKHLKANGLSRPSSKSVNSDG